MGNVTGSLKKAQAREKKAAALPRVLIKNVNVSDGKSEKLAMARDGLIDGNPIDDLLLLMN